jgi:hypothetical protein
MRYELGLDERPKRQIHGVKEAIELAEYLSKKETKMTTIDLSTAVAGNKFNTDGAFPVELVHKSADNTMFCLEHNGSLFILLRDGSSKHLNITSKHEPRHWLGQLPDADLFLDDVDFIHCDSNSDWLSASGNDEYYFNFIKMPTLTGDEWKQSKISIDELRAWQAENK